MIKTIYRVDGLYFYNRFFDPRVNFWKNLIENAISSRILRNPLDSITLAKQVIYLFIGSNQEWARGAISIDQMRSEIGYGISLLLLPFSCKNFIEFLHEKLDRFGSDLEVYRKIGPIPNAC